MKAHVTPTKEQQHYSTLSNADPFFMALLRWTQTLLAQAQMKDSTQHRCTFIFSASHECNFTSFDPMPVKHGLQQFVSKIALESSHWNPWRGFHVHLECVCQDKRPSPLAQSEFSAQWDKEAYLVSIAIACICVVTLSLQPMEKRERISAAEIHPKCSNSNVLCRDITTPLLILLLDG